MAIKLVVGQCFDDKPHLPHARLFSIKCLQQHKNQFHHFHKVVTSIPKPIPPYVGLNISCLGEGLLLMGVTRVDKNHPFKVNDSLFNNWSHCQQPFCKKLNEIVFQ